MALRDSCDGSQCVSQAYPSRRNTAGMGFRVSLGDLLGPNEDTTDDNTSNRWVFVSASGSQHAFWPRLHDDDCEDPGDTGNQHTDDYLYTRDGSHLRLRRNATASRHFVETPEGTIYQFEATTFDLARIEDQHGNWVAISRTSTTDTITDSVGREHRIVYQTHTGADPRAQRTVDRLELMAFGDGTGQRSAVWDLDYVLRNVRRPAPDPAPGSSLDTTSAKTFVPLLWRVSQPAGAGEFRFGPSATEDPWYHLDYGTHDGVSEYRTALPYRMELPTKGKVEWTWRRWALPAEPNENERFGAWLSSFAGVGSRSISDRNAATPEGTWTYTPELRNEILGDTTTPLVEHVVTVTWPESHHERKHYFSAAKEDTGVWKDEEYALPFTKRTSSGGRYLSHELLGGGNTHEQVYVAYDGDPQSGSDLDDLTNRNRRLVSNETVYLADSSRRKNVVRSQYDRFGNFRRVDFGGTFQGVNDRTVETRFNSGLGAWTGSCFAAWPATRPWVLGTFDQRDVTESGDTRRTEFWFGHKGLLLRRRDNRGAGGQGPAQTGQDVVVDYDYSSAGNLIQEQYFGGDDGTLVPAGALPGLALSNADYTVHHGHQHGVRSSTSFAAFPNERILDLTIDKASGLPSSTRDVAGVGASLTFDGLGRPTSATPTVPITGMPKDALSVTTYTAATAASDAEIVTRRKVGSSVHTTEEAVLDGLGRVKTEWRNDETGALVGRKRTYHPQGWLKSVSVWDDFSKTTEIPGYDPDGRPLKVISPDGTEVRFGHLGDSRFRRFVTIGGVERTHTEYYDRFGRLHQVTDPPGATATYSYDESGNLTSISMGQQSRSFTWDNRGFLVGESHPELGSPVTYDVHDSLGNPGKRLLGSEDGVFDLALGYDGAGRLTTIDEAGGAGRAIKLFEYGAANTSTSAEKGRLIGANRYNYFPYPATGANHKVKVRTDYEYTGRQGRMSDATVDYFLQAIGEPFFATPSRSFDWGQTYHALGPRDLLTYPKRAGATEDQPVYQHAVTNGWLTTVRPLGGADLATLDYHPNGTLAGIGRANGILDVHAGDPDGIPRPASLAVAKSGQILWTTGTYGFDAAGNITEMGGSRFTYDGISRLATARTCPDGSDPDGIFADGFESGDTSAWGGSGGGGPSGAPCIDGSYGYDAYGNLTSKTEDGTGTTWTVNPSTNRIAGLSYDDAGNVTGTGCAPTCATTYDFDDLNMLNRQATTGGEERYFVYDAFDERLITIDWGTSNWLWTVRDRSGGILRSWNQVGANDPISHRVYLYRGLQPLATRNYDASGSYTGEHYQLHLDHLGSTRLVTLDRDSGVGDGTIVSEHTFLPFGEEWQGNNGGERMRFTAQERMFLNPGGTGDDLDNFHARTFSPGLGRFLSVDPVMAGIADTQALNRYSYVTNRPMVYTDPTGMFRFPLPWGLPEATIEGEPITVTSGKYDLSGFGGFLYWGFFLQNMPVSWGSETTVSRPHPLSPEMTLEAADPCRVPPAPPGVDLQANVSFVESFAPTLSPFVVGAMSMPHRPWDFKRVNPKFEAFGNFHFGAAAAATGLPRAVVVRGGGLVNVATMKRKPGGQYFTMADVLWGENFGDDDPFDVSYVESGYDWYRDCR